MRGFLFLEMQMPGKKCSKIGHLARLFNAADAFSGAKYTRKSNGQDTLGLFEGRLKSGLDKYLLTGVMKSNRPSEIRLVSDGLFEGQRRIKGLGQCVFQR
ncbi:hypothetical protein LVJ83_00485 [Uruburuella testudinis]|uniref:Uncharacterized protein n=1 Tax=Uruburuella testudinis TaxID=1282863 RepID=A0ABY4DSG9_9NEIS|nr:hypothetical protein [Uruburuella testudinis]UOO81991.1 hypothetical protein LVJ83_00485 [Uruburuella testudinis]